MSNKILQPLKDHVLVEYIPKDKTEGGIVLPDTAVKKDDANWRVLAVGEEVKNIKKDDHILFDSRSSVKLNIDGFPENLYVLVSDSVIGIVKTVE